MSVQVALHFASLKDLEKVHRLIDEDIERALVSRWDWDDPIIAFRDPYASIPINVEDVFRKSVTSLDDDYVKAVEDFLGSTMWTCLGSGRTSDGGQSIGAKILSELEPLISILAPDEQARLIDLRESIDFTPLREVLEEDEAGLYEMMNRCISDWHAALKEGVNLGKFLVITWG